jgi:hypothetical protein
MVNDPLPRYWTNGEVRTKLDDARRSYRRSVLWLVFYQVLVLGPARWAADSLAEHQAYDGFHFIKPFILPGMVIAVLLIWFFGIRVIFRRRPL